MPQAKVQDFEKFVFATINEIRLLYQNNKTVTFFERVYSKVFLMPHRMHALAFTGDVWMYYLCGEIRALTRGDVEYYAGCKMITRLDAICRASVDILDYLDHNCPGIYRRHKVYGVPHSEGSDKEFVIYIDYNLMNLNLKNHKFKYNRSE